MTDDSIQNSRQQLPASRRRTSLAAAGGMSVAALVMGGMSEVLAQHGPVALEEIVVTARKRSESVQDIPIAVSALPKSIVADGNFDQVDKFVELVPNVKFKQDQYTSADISIRGSSRNVNTEDPGVGIYRDGVYIGGLLTSFSNFYDIERVEILRGPQAGLYGRNAVGGALNVYTVKPSLDGVEGYVDAQYGSKSRAELRGAVNVPLVEDRLALRLSGLSVDQDKGFQRVVNLNRYGDAFENRSARARLLFTPTSTLEFLTTAEYFKTHGNPGGLLVRAPNGVGTQVGPFVLPPTTVADLDHLQMDGPSVGESDQVQLIQEVNWDSAVGRVTATVGYRDTSLSSSSDNDYSTHDLSVVANDAGQDSFYAELRLASLDHNGFRFTAGATYLDEHLKLNQQYLSGGDFGVDFASWYATGLTTDNPFGVSARLPISELGLSELGNTGGWGGEIGDSFPVTAINEQDLKSFSAYVEANYALSDAIEIWANVRYTRDKKDITFGQHFGNDRASCPIACAEIFALTFDGLNPQFGYPASASFSRVSPGGGINYVVNDDVMVYAKVVTGFKAGGFNDLSASPALLPFDEETTISYEVGAKTSWWDERLTLNAAAFYQERKDALVEIRDPFMPIASLGINAGSLTNQGIEVEMRVVAAQGLEILLAGGYLDSELSEFKYEPQGIDYSGNTVPNTYKYTLSGVIRHTFALTDRWDWFTYVSYSNGWDGYTDADNGRKLSSPETVDLRLGLKAERWTLAGYIDNLTDHRYSPFETAFDAASHFGTFSPGRTYGAQLTYTF